MALSEIQLIYLFIPLLFGVAMLYASVGHGGASGYLALMALWSFPVDVMKPTALVLNLFVAGASFINYAKQGHFNFRLFLYFAVASVPMSFLGGMLQIDASLYKNLLAVVLLFGVLKLLGFFGDKSHEVRTAPLWQQLLIGAGIGFLSGLLGIGGGIILTPIILIMHWGNMKEAAAVSALFIWVNSASALAGFATQGISVNPDLVALVAIALAGGLLGGYLGSAKMDNPLLKKVLALVLVVASIKLIWT
jgi:uncharacterized membrane protein YfcA